MLDWRWKFIPVSEQLFMTVGDHTVNVGQNDVPGDNRPYIAQCSCSWVADKPRYGEHNAMDDGARHLLIYRK
jgi:hypothetical protein